MSRTAIIAGQGALAPAIAARLDNPVVAALEGFAPTLPHESFRLERLVPFFDWLAEQGASVVLVGGMGERAQQILESRGVAVVCGIAPGNPVEIVNQYLAQNLTVGGNACNHDAEDHHDCGH